MKRKTTGELELFKKIYEDRNQTCQITGQWISFSVHSFAHILSKGTRPDLRLNPDNIIMCVPEFHHAFDNEGREKTLKKYPQALWVYEKKEKLKEKTVSLD